MNAALAAKRNDSILGSRARRAQKQVATKIPSRKKLGSRGKSDWTNSTYLIRIQGNLTMTN